jgi:oligopeptide transport system ATP-binding protein
MVKNDHLIKAINLKVHFPVKEGFIKDIFKENKLYVKAVDGIDFYISHKETLGLVGESGCGKTTTGRALIGLNHLTEGKVYFSGEDISLLDENKIRLLRKKMQFIFQDPFSSLNPRMTINEIIGRPMKIFNLYDNEDRKNRIKDILDMVGLSPQHMSRYPHEFSGGQRQRISIARALAVEPEFIIADEPTAALDVSIQCQILNLLIKIKEELGLTVMFISHDLGVINHISDRTAVMYLGKIVEIGPKILKRPIYP